MDSSPTSDEKIMAALAHGSVFMMFLGPVIPAMIWAFQRKKSKYVSFHALQAMGYQALLFWLWIVVGFLIMGLAICLIFPFGIFITSRSHSVMPATMFGFQFLIFTLMFGSIGLFFLTGIIGAIFCLLGRDFRYPIIGKRLERYLSYQADPESQIDETREDNWVAAVCHATAVLQMWGMVTPLIVWFTQKDRSAHLRFQSMQAFIYQGVAFAVYMIGMMLYMIAVFGMMFTVIAAGSVSRGETVHNPAAIFMLIVFGVIILIWVVITLLVPIYLLLAAFASLRMLQGRPFHYPLIGGLLEKRMETSPTLEPAA